MVALKAPSPDVIFVMSPSRALFASSVLPLAFLYTIMASTAVASTDVIAVDPAGINGAFSGQGPPPTGPQKPHQQPS